MEMKLSGDLYNERITIKYEDITIYDGYVDHFVTSEDVNSEVELKLNYGDKANINGVIVKRLGEKIFCIPNIKQCFDIQYKYTPLIFTNKEFKEMWELMRYSFDDEISKIKEVATEELMLAWFVSSNFRDQVDNLQDYLSSFKEKILCIDMNDENVNNRILRLFDWDETINKISLKPSYLVSNNGTNVKIYLDNSMEWDAIKVTDKDMIYLRLSNDLYMSVLD